MLFLSRRLVRAVPFVEDALEGEEDAVEVGVGPAEP